MVRPWQAASISDNKSSITGRLGGINCGGLLLGQLKP
jgi:hypothetical protein